MKRTQSLLLIFTFIAIANLSLTGQDIGYYLREMNTDPEIDSAFNTKIDSIWSNINTDSINSQPYVEPVEELQKYYDAKRNAITGDKAELFSYFILLKNEDYQPIIERFESRLGDYNHRAFTTISQIYRRSFLKYHDSNITGYMYRLDSLSKIETSRDFQDFVAHVKDLQPGQKAPAFEVTDLRGQIHKLDSMRGKVIVLDFWATWCVPCVAELPKIKRINKKYRDNEDFIIISISLDTETEVWENFIKENGLEWPQVIEFGREDGASKNSGVMATMYKAMGVPKYILIDKEGYIRYNSHLSNYKFVGEEIIDRFL